MKTPPDCPCKKPAFTDADMSCGLSWGGFTLCGDDKSIKEVRRAIDSEAYYKGCTQELRDRVSNLNERLLQAEKKSKPYTNGREVMTFWRQNFLLQTEKGEMSNAAGWLAGLAVREYERFLEKGPRGRDNNETL